MGILEAEATCAIASKLSGLIGSSKNIGLNCSSLPDKEIAKAGSSLRCNSRQMSISFPTASRIFPTRSSALYNIAAVPSENGTSEGSSKNGLICPTAVYPSSFAFKQCSTCSSTVQPFTCAYTLTLSLHFPPSNCHIGAL